MPDLPNDPLSQGQGQPGQGHPVRPGSTENGPASAEEPSLDELVLIVVGAHLRAELSDRVVAYRVREAVERALAERDPGSAGSGGTGGAGGMPAEGSRRLRPAVCTDLWYLNDPALRQRPTISIGAPGVNALSAHLGSRLPSAFVIDDVLMVQMDLDPPRPVACCWGVTRAATSAAADTFVERYLADFLAAADGL